MDGERMTLFARGDGGCFGFRIPTIMALPSGNTLVFCEARRASLSDSGRIDIVMRRCGGRGFSDMQVVVSGGGNTVGNPCPIYDAQTGRLFLIYNANDAARPEGMILRGEGPRTVSVVYSDDEGETWSAPRDITAAVKPDDWTWYAVGPCHGVQLKSGRLMVGANHAVLDRAARRSGCYISHVLFSDDHGETWQLGPNLMDGTNECALTAFEDGGVLVNMRYIPFRENEEKPFCRAQAYSADSGLTFSRTALRPDLPDPVCQGSLLTVRTPRGEEPLLSNAAARERANLTIRRSADRGGTWRTERVIEKGPAAYSDMAQLTDGRIAVLFETGEKDPYERIDLEIFELSD